MKRFVCFLALILVLYSASSGTQSINVQPYIGSGHIESDVEFITNFATDQDVCTGDTITIDQSYTGKWPKSTASFDVLAGYPNCRRRNDPGRDCPASPVGYGTVNLNRDVVWILTGDYNEVINNYPPVLESPDGLIDQFSTQRVTYEDYEPVPGTGDPNKRGNVGIYCKGTALIRATKPSGTVVTLYSGNVSNVGDQTLLLDEAGDYTIETRLSSIGCFGAIEKYPREVGDYYWMDVYTENLFTYAGPITETKTVTAQAGSTSMIITDPSANTRFVLDEDRTQSVEIDVQNTGDADIQVTGVSIVPPASDQFEVAPGGDRGCRVCVPFLGCYTPPGCRASEDGFDVEIAPGNAQTLEIDIADIGAEACQGNSNAAVFVLTYEPVGEVCGGSEPQTVSRRYLIDCTNVPTGCTVNTDCEDNEICEGEGEDAICQEFTIDVTPNTATARSEGESVDFTATCRVDGAVTACNSIGTLEWTQAGTPVTLTPGTNRVTARTGSTAGTASITGRIQGKTPSDTSTLTIEYNGPGVVITPDTATVEETRSQEFEVTCYSRILDLTEVPCENVRWSSTGVPVTIAGRNDGATVTAGGVRGDATINAVATISGRDFSDDATLTIRAPIISCEIGPTPTENLEGNSPYEFEVECQRLGATIPCNAPLNWAVIGNADKIGEVGSSVVILTGNEDSGDSTITAHPANTDEQCELVLTVGTGDDICDEPPCECLEPPCDGDPDPPDDDDPPARDEGCTITGSKTLTKGETNVFRITCEARPSGDCEGVQWSVQNQEYFEPFSSRDYDDHQLVLKVKDDANIPSLGVETHVSARNRGSVPADEEFSCTIKSLLMSYLCEEIT